MVGGGGGGGGVLSASGPGPIGGGGGGYLLMRSFVDAIINYLSSISAPLNPAPGDICPPPTPLSSSTPLYRGSKPPFWKILYPLLERVLRVLSSTL